MPQGERLLRVAAARADFLENGREAAAGVPDALAASWERSQQAGIDSSHPLPVYTEIDTGSRLTHCALPVLERLGADTADLPLVIALTDARARLVRRIDSSGAVARLLDRVQFAPGFSYAEDQVGTNGVGTALESGRSFSVVGPEHFSEHLHAFACTGAPILDPLTGRVEGVLDITSLTQAWNPIMHTLVRSAATDIGRNLLQHRSQAQQAIFEAYIRADARDGRQAVLAFGDSVFMANAAAQKLFAPDEQLVIREHAAFVLARRDRAGDTVSLPSGRRVRVHGTRILAGSGTMGMVVVAELVDRLAESPSTAGADTLLPTPSMASTATRQIAGDLHRPHSPIARGTSPAWIRTCGELAQALHSRKPTLVLGETGAGKFTLLNELFHGAFPGGRSMSFDANQVAVPAGPELDALIGGRDEPTLYIIRNIDEAHTDAIDRIESAITALGARHPNASFAATLSDCSLDSDLPFHALLGHFEVAVTVPPLRHRTEDLTLIVNRLLGELASQRTVRISPAAMRLIGCYSWPRNVTQLREALHHALRRRPVGELQTDDLPSYCHTTARRTLTAIETAERDAIVTAIRDAGGNRQLAAQNLGIARSSLYRKLKAYGITA